MKQFLFPLFLLICISCNNSSHKKEVVHEVTPIADEIENYSKQSSNKIDTLEVGNSDYFVVVNNAGFPDYFNYQIFKKNHFQNQLDSVFSKVHLDCQNFTKLVHQDMNFDGIKDLGIMYSSCNAHSNNYQDVYIFQNEKLKKYFSNLRNPHIVNDEKRLYSYGWWSGDRWFDIYQWKEDSFFIEQRHEVIYNKEIDSFEYTFYQYSGENQFEITKYAVESHDSTLQKFFEAIE